MRIHIDINGTPEEIAALATAMQERRPEQTVSGDSVMEIVNQFLQRK